MCALRLDGDLFAVGDGYVCADTFEDAAVRIGSIADSLRGPRIAARETASWVFGATDECPRPIEVIVPAGKSQSTEAMRGVRVRESVLRDDEVIGIGGLRVTSPLRTAVDLVRMRSYSPATATMVAALLRNEGIGTAAVLALLADRRFQRERIRGTRRILDLPIPD
ncbi:hypothetical protein DDQ50_11495 [Amnibacterium flavum]|uniref:AbiEi antitoxin C-terminal domain-containing protein n=1 Tax=Amnibacterium flavum TaxID=2173173 RepID=A0A2V1HRE5_9MICO|nr:hypothetical protein DDQ50_11495 [Amnibacterium flavum]